MKNLMNNEFYIKHKTLINKLFIIFCVFIFLLLVWLLFIKNIFQFKQMEKELTTAGKMYFERNLDKYPKEENAVSTVSLQKLYDRGLINALKIPGKDTFCSTDDSWVKAKKTKSGYDFYTYLHCGNYESTIDHEGPIIELNGNDSINLETGKSYKEEGVKSVVDKKEGNIDIKKVSITGNVDTTLLGTYKIKYVAYDSLKNKTIKYRTVKVVKTLDFITKQDTKTKIYQGGNVNNYVLYSGMIWRIIKANDDGTVKLITNDTLANTGYSTGMEKNGYVYKWLNDYFYKKLYKPNKYIVNSSWCNDTTNNINDTGKCKDNSIKAKVGLLTLSEYNNSRVDDNTYLNNGMTFWTMTKNGNNDVYANYTTYEMGSYKVTTYNGVRPVINIKKDISVEKGNGTFDKPYVLEGYNFANSGTKLNTRISGEYVKYSGYLWRIIGTDNDNTKVVMDNVLINKDRVVETSYGKKYDNKSKVFDINNKDSIGYKINKELKDYVITKKMVKGDYNLDYYKNGIKDSNKKNRSVNCLLSIPDITEIFSIGTAEFGHNSFYVRNILDSKEKLLVVNSTAQTDEFYNFVFESNGVKLVTYFNSDTKIKGGRGTYNSPYELR